MSHFQFFLCMTLIFFLVVHKTFGCASKSNVRDQKQKIEYHYHFNDPHRKQFVPYHKHTSIVPTDKVLVPEDDLPIPKTSCGRMLCPTVSNYPLAEINVAVDRARGIFRSGITIKSFKDQGINFNNFTSKYDTFWFGERAPDHRFVDINNDCGERVNTIFPQEGYSTENKKSYYIVNVPTLYRGLTNMVCKSNNQMCSKGNEVSATLRSCRQMYREEQLLVLPISKYHFSINDFELRTFLVPTGCACIASK